MEWAARWVSRAWCSEGNTIGFNEEVPTSWRKSRIRGAILGKTYVDAQGPGRSGGGSRDPCAFFLSPKTRSATPKSVQ